MGSLCDQMDRLNSDYKQSDSEQISMAQTTSEQFNVWHQRLGHCATQRLKLAAKKGQVRDLSFPEKSVAFLWGCVKGKLHKKPFLWHGEIRTKEPLELVHSDMCDPDFPLTWWEPVLL